MKSGAGGIGQESQGGAAIEVAGVSKTFRLPDGKQLRAVADVTFEIEPGSMIAIVGPSGSGKSTLLHLLGGLLAPDSGRIQIDSLSIAQLRGTDLTNYRRTVGFVFQRYYLLPALTAIDNVIAPVLPRHTEYDKSARASELLAAVGLGERLRSVPALLSGGEQQRVAIARALINRPRLLLADEPTGNLDSVTATNLVKLLDQLRRQYGTTTVIATHDPRITAQCDRVLPLADGRLAPEHSTT
jgi:putative ABC transport system ATP-binding protein